MKRRKVSFHSEWNITCRDKGGNIKWQELGLHNILHDEGEQAMLQAMFSEAYTVPASYYIALDDRVTLAEADTLVTMNATEPAVGGYARQAVNSDATDFTVTQDAGNYQAKTKTVNFAPSGANYPTVRNCNLGDQASGTAGKIIFSVTLSQSRIVLDGDNMDVDMTIKLSE